MPNTKWQVKGDYFETCSCDYLCPCISGDLAARPTQGYCAVAMVFHIDQGQYDGTLLNNLSFAVLALTPEEMGKGNWSVGVITDDRATPEQQQAMVAIASGQAGGPMAGLAPLITTFLGAEARPIQFEKKDMSRSVSIPGALEQGVEGVPGTANPKEPLYLDNTLHPANPRLALAKSVGSHMHAFGLNWDETSGKNNGHFAPFNWQGG